MNGYPNIENKFQYSGVYSTTQRGDLEITVTHFMIN